VFLTRKGLTKAQPSFTHRELAVKEPRNGVGFFFVNANQSPVRESWRTGNVWEKFPPRANLSIKPCRVEVIYFMPKEIREKCQCNCWPKPFGLFFVLCKRKPTFLLRLPSKLSIRSCSAGIYLFKGQSPHQSAN